MTGRLMPVVTDGVSIEFAAPGTVVTVNDTSLGDIWRDVEAGGLGTRINWSDHSWIVLAIHTETVFKSDRLRITVELVCEGAAST